MLDILFIIPHPDRPYLDKKGLCPPIGLGLLCTYLKGFGLNCEILDMYAHKYTQKEVLNEIEKLKPHYIGLSLMFSESKKVGYILAQRCKEMNPHVQIIAGGVDATFRGVKFVKECKYIDYVVTYEGEETILELIRSIEAHKPLNNIKGLIYKDDGKIVVTPTRPPINFSSLPVLDRSFYNLDNYMYPYTMMTSKGCPYNCLFCGGGAVGRGYQLRNIDSIEQEISSLSTIIKNRGDISDHHLIFWDDAFSIYPDRIIEIGKIATKYGIKWGCQCRVNEISTEYLKLMKQYNCQKLNFGVESGDEKVLEDIKKGITLSDVIKIAEYCSKIKLPTSFNFLIPLPTDTEESVKNTIAFAEKINSYDYISISFNVTTPFPGTYMYENKDKLKIKSLSDKEEDFNFRNPVFETEHLHINEIRKYLAEAFILEAKSKQQKKILNIKY